MDNNHSDSDNDNTALLVSSHGWWSAFISEQKCLLERLDKVVQRSQKYIDEEKEPYGQFRNVLINFKDVVTKPEYNYTSYTPYSVYGSSFSNKSNTGFDDDAVQGVKSEIRSFKGMLLSRRNFPKAQLKPSASPTPSTPSLTTAVSNEDINDNDKNNDKKIDVPITSSILNTNTVTPSSSSSTSQAYHPRQRESQSFRSELHNKSLEVTTSPTTTTAPAAEAEAKESNPTTTITTASIDKGKGKETEKSSVTIEEVKESSDDN
ncbi:hypothetical protein BJ944DRAFT_23249 [Cunninghamella echinulata]|nr:hypothetical protein BJ944DRAFT_23249 [Cunninghamella echinulata]